MATSDGRLIDRATQSWVRATGRLLDLADHPWFAGPTGDPSGIGDEWIDREAARLGGQVAASGPDDGLLASMGALAGQRFDPNELRSEIVGFYEHTTRWRLELWFQWSALAWPFGWAISTLFARRLHQLSLPLRPLDSALGIDSRVVKVVDDQGAQLGAAWLRTLRSTGDTVYSGWYGTTTLPGRDQPSVRVVFPLPNGSVTVFLRPEVTSGGGLRLVSPLEPFGGDGAYLVVCDRPGASAWVRRVPIVERFDLYVDDEGILRTNHWLRLWSLPVIDLHYRIDFVQVSSSSKSSGKA
jgi:hypothetical protein